MAKATAFVAGLALGFVFATSLMASHAEDVNAEVSEAAAAAHVDPIKLQGAVNTTGDDPYVYLRGVGELPPLPALSGPASVRVDDGPTPAQSSRVACIVRVESKGDPGARNRSGAAGLGQFLPSTWLSTPQGRAGLSVFNASANRAAIQWMLDVGRAREFDAVRYFGC